MRVKNQSKREKSAEHNRNGKRLWKDRIESMEEKIQSRNRQDISY